MSDKNVEKGKSCNENDFDFSFYQWKNDGMYSSIDKTTKNYGEDLKNFKGIYTNLSDNDIENSLNKSLFYEFIAQFSNMTSGRFKGGEGFYTLQLTIKGVEELHKAKKFWRNILKSFLHFLGITVVAALLTSFITSWVNNSFFNKDINSKISTIEKQINALQNQK